MPLNFGLADAAARVPLAGGPVTPVTGDQSFKTMNDQMDTGEKDRGLQQAAQDRGALDEYLKNGGDLYTAPGATKALGDLRGKVGSDVYMKLAAHADQMRKSEVAFNNDLVTADENKLKLYNQRLEYTMPLLDQLKQTYEKTKAEKGEVTAKAEFDAAKAKLLSGADQSHGGYHPELMDVVGKASPENIDGLMANTSYHKNKVEAAYKEAQTRKDNAMAEAYAGKGWEVYEDPQGNVYRANAMLGKTQRQMPDGAFVDAPLPQNAKPVKGAGKNGAGSGLMADATDFTKNPPTDEENLMADKSIIDGKLPSFGNGALAAQKKIRVAMLAAQRATGRGMDASALQAFQTQAKAVQISVNNLEKQQGVIAAGEKAVLGNLDQIMELATKVDPSGVPLLNKYIQAGKKAIAGDPDTTALHAVIESTADELAKVLSASTGAAGITEGGRKQAQDILGKNLTLEQFKSLKENLTREMATRVKANTDQIYAEAEKLKLPPMKEDHAKVDPKTQAERDKDAVGVQRAEYDKTIKKLKDEKDPDQRRRLMTDARSLRSELSRAGVKDLPPLTDEPTAAPTPAGGKKVVKFGELK